MPKSKCSNEFRRKKHMDRSTMKRGGAIIAVTARGKPRALSRKDSPSQAEMYQKACSLEY